MKFSENSLDHISLNHFDIFLDEIKASTSTIKDTDSCTSNGIVTKQDPYQNKENQDQNRNGW